MNDEQFKALAREFAKAVNCSHLHILEDKEEPLTDIPEEYLEWYADCLTSFLQWLSCRFCLVEKERVKDEYHEAKFACGNVDPCSETWATYQAQKSVLERLFPEIAKEVNHEKE